MSKTIGPISHRDIIGILGSRGFEPIRGNRLGPDAAQVARIAGAAVEKAVAPILDTLAAMGDRIDRAAAHRDAIREAERTATPPAGYVRDAASGNIRPRTARDLAAANDAFWGRKA